MELRDAVNALSGLANETRLAIFRHLVQQGPEGEAAGDLAQRFALPGPTLSFHLSQLCQCGLLSSKRRGRHILYSADYAAMSGLMGFLTENCCGGDPDRCESAAARSCLPGGGDPVRRTGSDR